MPHVKRATDYVIPVANTLSQMLSALLEAQVWLLLDEFRHKRKKKNVLLSTTFTPSMSVCTSVNNL